MEYDPATGSKRFIHEGYQAVKAVPFDMPILGYNNKIVNTLRIWDAEPIVDFGLDSFDKGDYKKAVEQENLARNIVEVLYPNDNHMAGKELRLKQQYFFVSAREPIVDVGLDSFDKGDYKKAVEQENLARKIVEVLYPNDNHMAGKELRLKQQYFFVSASLQAAIEKYKKIHSDIRKLYCNREVQENSQRHP